MMGAPDALKNEPEPIPMIADESAKEQLQTSFSMSSVQQYFSKNFEPGPNHVICQRGKDCQDHVGNRKLREVVEKSVQAYLHARSRQHKSAVISRIVTEMDASSGSVGAFVIRDQKRGRWHKVAERVARDKVGNLLRDLIKERSSTDLLGESNDTGSSSVSGTKRRSSHVSSTSSEMPSPQVVKRLQNSTSGIFASSTNLSSLYGQSPPQRRTPPSMRVDAMYPSSSSMIFPPFLPADSSLQGSRSVMLTNTSPLPAFQDHQLNPFPRDLSRGNVPVQGSMARPSLMYNSPMMEEERMLSSLERLAESLEMTEEDVSGILEPRPIGDMQRRPSRHQF